MKLLVMSDSHKTIDHMRFAVGQESPDAIIHLGDHISDARKLKALFHDTTFHVVTGNCDYPAGGENELFLTLDNVNILVTHGHKYGVKSGIASLIERARGLGANVALYGHTHHASLRFEYGIWFLCPGQMQHIIKHHPASYGVVSVDGANTECRIEMLQA